MRKERFCSGGKVMGRSTTVPFCREGKLRLREGERLAKSAGKFVPEPALSLNKVFFPLPRAKVRWVEVYSEKIFQGSLVGMM